MILEIRIPGPPVPQGRPRATRLGNRAVTLFDPPKSRAWKKHAAQCCLDAMTRRDPTSHEYFIPEGPVFLRVIAIFPRPKAMKGDGRVLHTRRGDLSNVTKAVEDALNGLAYADDSQVAHSVCTKWYAEPGEEPCVMVWVSDEDMGLFDYPKEGTCRTS
jgi:Holliday junction resolvase RusA-like endonuclease